MRYKKAKTICESLKQGAGIYQSCSKAGLSAMSFWRWRQENPKFDKFVERLLAGRTQLVIDALYKKALEGNPTAMIFWLKNKAGWRDVIEHSGKIEGGETRIIIIKNKQEEKPDEHSRDTIRFNTQAG